MELRALRRALFRTERALASQTLHLPGPVVSFLGRRRAARIDGRTLDPQVAALLVLDGVRGPLDVTKYDPATARRKMATSFALLDLPPDPSVEARPIGVRGAGGELDARLYVPLEIPTRSPLVVYFHGGGMVTGDLRTYDALCRHIARWAKVRLVSVAYRLAPEHPFPAAPDDATTAFYDIAARAEALGGDPARLAVMGDSAGGTLAATVSQRTARGTTRPALQVLVYPATDLTHGGSTHQTLGEGFLLTSAMINWFMNHYFSGGGDRRDPEASPLFREDVSTVAPALVYTAGFDPLRSEGEAYADKLRAAGRLLRHREFGSLPHGFAQIAGVVDAARAAVDEIADDVSKALG